MGVTPNQKEMVINAIRVLRGRRVRPSLYKIAWFVRRHNLLSEGVTEAVLDELVESEDVLRVEYKGATSYRVASCWSKAKDVQQRPTRTKVNVMNSESTCRALRNAVKYYGPNGATKDQISERLHALGQDRLAEKLKLLLFREIRSGSLYRVETTRRTDTIITYRLPPQTAGETEDNHLQIKNEGDLNGYNEGGVTSPSTVPAHDQQHGAVADDVGGAGRSVRKPLDAVKTEASLSSQVQRQDNYAHQQRPKHPYTNMVGRTSSHGMASSDMLEESSSGGRRAKYEYKRLLEEAGDFPVTRARGRPRRCQPQGVGVGPLRSNSPKRGRQPSQRSKV